VRATSASNNCAFARQQAAVGGEEVVDVARRLGISTLSDSAANIPSLTLGSASVRPLEMAGAYAAIANEGRYNEPHFVTKVEDRDGNVLYEAAPADDQVISEEVARRATVALSAVVSGGTYKGGSLPDRRPAAGKTGTNELDDGGNADVWFVGFTPQIATAVWIGNPAGSLELEGSGVQGGTAAGKVWREFMFPYLENTPVIEFTDPLSNGRSSSIKDPWSRFSTRSDSSTRSGSSGTSRSSSNSSSSTRRTTTIPPASPAPGDDGGAGGGGTDPGSGGGSEGEPPPSGGAPIAAPADGG